MKKFTYLILSSLIFVGCASQYPELDSGLYADIETNKGSIVVSLELEKTPVTVANFVSLSEGENEMVSKKFLNKKNFPFSKKINFNSLRKGEIIGEHEVKFSSGKEIITLNHEAFDRALYSEGALTAAKWLINKKTGLYSMRDLMNFK